MPTTNLASSLFKPGLKYLTYFDMMLLYPLGCSHSICSNGDYRNTQNTHKDVHVHTQQSHTHTHTHAHTHTHTHTHACLPVAIPLELMIAKNLTTST